MDRRGLPKLCYSDNGTNLVAGEQEINRALSRWIEADLIKKIEKLKNQPVEWRFSPPVAPHFGGSWERLIKSAKSALRAILNERSKYGIFGGWSFPVLFTSQDLTLGVHYLEVLFTLAISQNKL